MLCTVGQFLPGSGLKLHLLYHLQCGIMFRRYQKGEIKYSGFKLRLWNEVATILLVSIVFIVVLKDLSNWIWGLVGLVIFSLLLLIAIKVYKKVRENATPTEKRN